jgi:hypothetical protein
MEKIDILCVCVDCLDCILEESMVEIEPLIFLCLVCYKKRCGEGVINGRVDVYA